MAPKTDVIEQLRVQLAAAHEEIERYKASPTVETCRQMIESQAVKENKILFDQLTKAEQLWQVAQGRCDGLEEKLAKAEQRVAEWQPIETAPKNGTYLCLGHGGTPFICLARNGEWFRQSAAKRVVGLTHWMPLPKAPNGASS